MGIVFKSDACEVLLECEIVARGESDAREKRGLPAALTQAIYNWHSQVAGRDGRVPGYAPVAGTESR
jgi:hypothetical protein